MPDEIRQLARNILKTPVTVQINANAPTHTVSHALYPVPEALKRQLLISLLQKTPTGRVVIFTRTKHRARTLARELENHDYRVTQLQGNLSQNRRQAALDGFREGKFDMLVATDIAAHGIDVSEVTHVINFDIPDTVDAYTHRIGRTGRALHTGEAFTLATPDDAQTVRAVERVLGSRIERRALPGFNYGDFSPTDPFPPQAPRQTRPGATPSDGGGSNGSAPRRNDSGGPGSRPPQFRSRPQDGGSADRRKSPPTDGSGFEGGNRGSGASGRKPNQSNNSGRPGTASPTRGNDHSRTRRPATSGRPSR